MSSKGKSSEIKIPSVLAFARKFDPSDALLFSGKWEARSTSEKWPAISIREKSVRGTISNRLKAGEQGPAKLDANIEDPNPPTVDIATLPPDADTLKVQFTLRVLAGVGLPSACNNIDYQRKLAAVVEGYVKEYGFTELARRYAANLANGRFLWRNRIGAEEISIQVAHLRDGIPLAQWVFNAFDYSLHDFAESTKSQSIIELADLINSGLTGNQHVLLQVTAFVRIAAGQEVFPSQELILERERGDKSKTLYHVNNVAAIHSQKLGNALRTIDTWYAEAEENGPIAVEPYGSVTVQGKAWRQPSTKQDFYHLLDNWIIKDKAPSAQQQHYVMAILIRGGVFGDTKKDKKKKED